MLKEKIATDIKSAMKNADEKTVGVLRLVASALHNKEIDKKGKGGPEFLTEEEVIQTLMTEAKKCKEAIEIFTKGNRPDLADKEKAELAIIQKYLPAQMNREEVEKLVGAILSKVAVKEIGPAMKEVMKELRGKADSGLVSEIVKANLGQK